MIVYEVFGWYNGYEGDDWSYGLYATREIAEKALKCAETITPILDGEPEYEWEIVEREVIAKERESYRC